MRMSVGRVARLRWAAGPGGFVRSLKSTRKERNLDKNFNFELGADLGAWSLRVSCAFRVLSRLEKRGVRCRLKREECNVDLPLPAVSWESSKQAN